MSWAVTTSAPDQHQVYRTAVAVDSVGSTRWTDVQKRFNRQLMYDIVGEAFQHSGIQPEFLDPLVDRGDGILALIRPVDDVAKTILLTKFVPKLSSLLVDHARDPAPLRLRAVIHAGEVQYDSRGPFGEAIDTCCCLLDHDEVKRFVRESALLSIVSHDIYRTVVCQCLPELVPSCVKVEFRRNDRTYRGWVLT